MVAAVPFDKLPGDFVIVFYAANFDRVAVAIEAKQGIIFNVPNYFIFAENLDPVLRWDDFHHRLVYPCVSRNRLCDRVSRCGIRCSGNGGTGT